MTNFMNRLLALNRRLHSLLQYDFCPSLNGWVYWLKHPLSCVVLIALVGLTCWLLVNPQAWIILVTVTLIGLLGTIWPWLSIYGLDCEVRFAQRRGREGEPADVLIRIRNRCPWPVWGLSLKQGFGPAGQSTGVSLACVGGWSTTEFVWHFSPEGRGIYPLCGPLVESGFPFGICHGRRAVRFVGQLIVWPQSTPLHGMPDAVEVRPLHQRMADRRVGDMGDVIGTREFRVGDALRRVHWAQSARHRRLIVTERQAPAACSVELIVDVDTTSHDGAGRQGTLEQTLRIAASLCESLQSQHSSIECAVGADRCSIGSSPADLHRVLDLFARVPNGGRPSSKGACRFHGRAAASRIVITTSKAFLRHLRHRHSASSDRFIIVRISDETQPDDEHGVCTCRPWIEVASHDSLAAVLPDRWRRACHV